jgi:hypothetical protein
VEITPAVVRRYQADRLAAKAGPKTINDEVLLLLRLCGDQGELIRANASGKVVEAEYAALAGSRVHRR